jgi:hypothetical protein
MAQVDITCGARGLDDRAVGACLNDRRPRLSWGESVVACWSQDTRSVGVRADSNSCRGIVGAYIGEEKESESRPRSRLRTFARQSVPSK